MASASFEHIAHQFVESLKTDFDEKLIQYPGTLPSNTLHMTDNVMGELDISIHFSKVLQMYGALREGEDVMDTDDVCIVCVIHCKKFNTYISRTTRPIDIWERWPEMTEALIKHTMHFLDQERAAAGHI